MTGLGEWLKGSLDTGAFCFGSKARQPEVEIVRVIVPPGPRGYLVRDVGADEWEAFELTHGHEASELARRFKDDPRACGS